MGCSRDRRGGNRPWCSKCEEGSSKLPLGTANSEQDHCTVSGHRSALQQMRLGTEPHSVRAVTRAWSTSKPKASSSGTPSSRQRIARMEPACATTTVDPSLAPLPSHCSSQSDTLVTSSTNDSPPGRGRRGPVPHPAAEPVGVVALQLHPGRPSHSPKSSSRSRASTTGARFQRTRGSRRSRAPGGDRWSSVARALTRRREQALDLVPSLPGKRRIGMADDPALLRLAGPVSDEQEPHASITRYTDSSTTWFAAPRQSPVMPPSRARKEESRERRDQRGPRDRRRARATRARAPRGSPRARYPRACRIGVTAPTNGLAAP